jgi:hypothetical protein
MIRLKRAEYKMLNCNSPSHSGRGSAATNEHAQPVITRSWTQPAAKRSTEFVAPPAIGQKVLVCGESVASLRQSNRVAFRHDNAHCFCATRQVWEGMLMLGGLSIERTCYLAQVSRAGFCRSWPKTSAWKKS